VDECRECGGPGDDMIVHYYQDEYGNNLQQAKHRDPALCVAFLTHAVVALEGALEMTRRAAELALDGMGPHGHIDLFDGKMGCPDCAKQDQAISKATELIRAAKRKAEEWKTVP